MGQTVLAGTRVTFEGTKIATARLLGVAGGDRVTTVSYAGGGRVNGMIATAPGSNAPAPGVAGSRVHDVNDAEFTTAITRTNATGGAAPPKVFAEGEAHKIASLNGVPFKYQKVDGTEGGALRTEDERFRYEFDERQRLSRVTQKATTGAMPMYMRAVYSYTAMDRVVGRRVEVALASAGTPTPDSAWRLATAQEMVADSLPASTTFVWDPISDQLVAIFEAEKYEGTGVVASGRPLRQFIHGGMGLDDPIEVTVADALGVRRLYPVYDEAATGALQAILDDQGNVIQRTFLADAYGAEETSVTAPTAERLTLTTVKNTEGAVTSVKVSLRITEPVAAETVETGARLTSVTATGTTAYTSPLTATLADAHTLQWTISATEWTALTTATDAHALSVAVTPTLRSTTFGPAVAITAPLAPSSGVITDGPNPFEYREPLTTFTTLATGQTTTTPYELPSLADGTTPGAPTSHAATLITATFQAQPFYDAFTRKNYVRARWYDPMPGSFLTPDPMRYEDSANMYAFAGGDPVNRRDPTGEMTEAQLQRFIKLVNSATRAGKGSYGEKVLERMLKKSGRVILTGPLTSGKAWNQGGADIIAYNPRTKQIEFWDNKFFMFKKNVSAADTLTNPVKLQRNIDEAIRILRHSNIPDKARLMFNLARGHGFLRFIGGAGTGNTVQGITKALKSLNVRFGSSAFIKRSGLSRRAVKGVALAGTVFAIAGYADELRAAANEDREFEMALDEMGRDCAGCHEVSGALRNASLLTSLVGIGGEEVLGNLGSVGGAALAGLLGLPSGPGAFLTAAGGAVAGGMIGDAAGRGLGTTLVDFVLAENDVDN